MEIVVELVVVVTTAEHPKQFPLIIEPVLGLYGAILKLGFGIMFYG